MLPSGDVPTRAQEEMKTATRREVISRGFAVIGWGSFAATCGLGIGETIRFFFPKVIFQSPSKFVISPIEEFLLLSGDADTYGVIDVDNRWRTKHKFFVVRERAKIYALSARCTHLGCTINWFDDMRIFKCPCHGSEYRSNGINFAGPAPRMLDRFSITLNQEGILVVDTGITYDYKRFDVDGASIVIPVPNS